MSIEIMNRVLENCEAIDESSHMFVLLMLANCANADGFCYPSRGYLAKMTRLCTDTVSDAIKQLCAEGHLTENRRPGRNSTFLVHPKLKTPRTIPGVEPSPSQNAPAAMNAVPSSVAPRAADRSSSPRAPTSSAAQIAAAAASNLSTNPPNHSGGICGQVIHSSPTGSASPPEPFRDTPRTIRDETSEKHQKNSEASDDLKKSLPEKITEKSRRAALLDQRQPTAAERERARVEQLQKIEQALQSRGAHA